ncbi:Crp/Fnr family transcriptional regulator [Mucilaginibacter sp. JRF]|uniref:Crp/Fnr family transcriptional regulator n=1 Tax=Mucilaginibacter sp. JRF TaxID=2780088 RepID=UPI001883024C|nr:Crp/Fnr family transcriptional regulator [Mucilaginibacter sp. JRF]MBE9586235.1 Crp/Fnr family transcriptional regulator [Mucilaginibacter sp. JRF]
MKAFIDYILQFGNLNKQQIDFIESKASRLTLPKDTYFIEAGKTPKQVAFLLEGIFRFTFYDKYGKEITIYFIDRNQFITDYPKFKASLPASKYLQSVTDCKLLVFSKKDWDEITNTITVWDTIVSKMYQKCLFDALNKNPLDTDDETTRYLSLINKSPKLANNVPLSYIASYLGITEEALVEIRNNL